MRAARTCSNGAAARMTGGGFGGSAIALVDAASGRAVGEAIAAAYGARGWEPPRFLGALPSGPAGRTA